MRAPIAALLLLAAGCGQQPEPANNSQPPVEAVLPMPASNVVESTPEDPPVDLAAMSPRQRRAYEKGLADCRAGRYAPDPWPEAYRIGCAAANDR